MPVRLVYKLKYSQVVRRLLYL